MEQPQNRPLHMTLGQKIFSRVMYFALGIASVGVGLILYWAFTGTDALVIKNAPLPVQPKFVKSLENVVVTVDFCKVTDAPGRVVRKLVSDKTELLAPVVDEALPKKCYNNLPVQVPIPDQTPLGKYKVVYRVTYKTNPLHEVTEEFESQQFEVVQ